MTDWKPAMSEVRWDAPPDSRLDGETWPEAIEVQAWEQNEDGERRIKARRRYILAD